MGDEGGHIFMLVRVAQKPWPFVADDDIFVLIYHIQLGLKDGEKGVVFGGGVKKLIVDIKLQNISGVYPIVPLGASAIDLYPLEADIFLGKGGGEEGYCLAQPPVQPLSRVIFGDGEFFHSGFSSFAKYCSIRQEKREESI